MDLDHGQCQSCWVGRIEAQHVMATRYHVWMGCTRCNAGYSVDITRVEDKATAEDVDAAIKAFRRRPRR